MVRLGSGNDRAAPVDKSARGVAGVGSFLDRQGQAGEARGRIPDRPVDTLGAGVVGKGADSVARKIEWQRAGRRYDGWLSRRHHRGRNDQQRPGDDTHHCTPYSVKVEPERKLPAEAVRVMDVTALVLRQSPDQIKTKPLVEVLSLLLSDTRFLTNVVLA